MEEDKNDEGNSQEEEKENKITASVLKNILPFIIFILGIVCGIITYHILNWFKIFILRTLVSPYITAVFIYTISFFVAFLVWFIFFPNKKISKISSILMTISIIILVGDIVIWLFSYGPLKQFGEEASEKLDKTFNSIGTFFCYVNPERAALGNFEECEKKDYEKIGSYKGIEISLEDSQYGSYSTPRAGESYGLNFRLTNKNIQPTNDLVLKRGTYDIRVEEVIGIASPLPIREGEEYIYTSVSPLDRSIRPGETISKKLIFQRLPPECQGIMYFKIIVKTTQNSTGKSEFLFLPDKEVGERFIPKKLTSPGPIDVITYVSPRGQILKEDINDASVIVNIRNKKDVTKLNSVRLLIQRDYVKIEKCEDDWLNKLDISFCSNRDASVCVDINLNSLDENRILKGSQAYSIECKISFDKNRYIEAEKQSFIVAEVNYNYNYEQTFSIKAEKCKSFSPKVTTPTGECKLPNVCKKSSCPEGYEPTSGRCDIPDSICCKPTTTYNSYDCPDLTNNCPTPEEVFPKISCEAKKAGVPADIMIGIAMQENSGYHCYDNGTVKTGDEGKSIGLMQVSQCSNTGDVHNVNENIRCAINHLKEKCSYSRSSIINENGRCNPTGYCTDEGVKCEYCYNVPGVQPKIYEGWWIAVRGYNGWGACTKQANYNYVEKVKEYAETVGSRYV